MQETKLSCLGDLFDCQKGKIANDWYRLPRLRLLWSPAASCDAAVRRDAGLRLTAWCRARRTGHGTRHGEHARADTDSDTDANGDADQKCASKGI